jgi:hypothetical protein
MKFTGKMNDEDLINKIVRLMQTDNSEDAPADAVQWSKNLFRTRAREAKKSLVRRIVAALQMDLSPDKAAFGERSAASSAARQMLFGAGANSIDLRITKTGKGFAVAGQVLGEGFAGAEVKLFSESKIFVTKSNELSEFRFENVSKDSYTLSLIFRDKEILVENIKIV